MPRGRCGLPFSIGAAPTTRLLSTTRFTRGPNRGACSVHGTIRGELRTHCMCEGVEVGGVHIRVPFDSAAAPTRNVTTDICLATAALCRIISTPVLLCALSHASLWWCLSLVWAAVNMVYMHMHMRRWPTVNKQAAYEKAAIVNHIASIPE